MGPCSGNGSPSGCSRLGALSWPRHPVCSPLLGCCHPTLAPAAFTVGTRGKTIPGCLSWEARNGAPGPLISGEPQHRETLLHLMASLSASVCRSFSLARLSNRCCHFHMEYLGTRAGRAGRSRQVFNEVGEGQASSWHSCPFSMGLLWGSPPCVPCTSVVLGPDVPSREVPQQQGHGRTVVPEQCSLQPTRPRVFPPSDLTVMHQTPQIPVQKVENLHHPSAHADGEQHPAWCSGQGASVGARWP